MLELVGGGASSPPTSWAQATVYTDPELGEHYGKKLVPRVNTHAKDNGGNSLLRNHQHSALLLFQFGVGNRTCRVQIREG
jgi:hypothetical protein